MLPFLHQNCRKISQLPAFLDFNGTLFLTSLLVDTTNCFACFACKLLRRSYRISQIALTPPLFAPSGTLQSSSTCIMSSEQRISFSWSERFEIEKSSSPQKDLQPSGCLGALSTTLFPSRSWLVGPQVRGLFRSCAGPSYGPYLCFFAVLSQKAGDVPIRLYT